MPKSLIKDDGAVKPRPPYKWGGKQQDLLIRRVYTDLGISICMEIDFEKQTISMVDRKKHGTYGPKDWQFYGRETKYMGGWLRIFTVMTAAVIEATKVLEAFEQQKTEDFALMLLNIDKNKSLKEDGDAR
jgi:hypothetical protein